MLRFETIDTPLNDWHFHPTFLSAHFKLSYAFFCKSPFFSHYVTLLFDDDRTQSLLVLRCGVRSSSALTARTNFYTVQSCV